MGTTMSGDYARVYREIESLATLCEDWDSYSAKSVSEAVRKSARLVAEDCEGWRLPHPSVTPTPDGGIQLLWRIQARRRSFQIAAIVHEASGELEADYVDEPSFVRSGKVCGAGDPHGLAREVKDCFTKYGGM